MTEEVVDLTKLRLQHSLRRFRTLVIGEVVLIVLLMAWLSFEYQGNLYMRQWLAGNFWPAEYLLNGYLVTAIAGFLVGWAASVLRSRRSRDQAILDALRRMI